MNRSPRFVLFACLAFLLSASIAQAWNYGGHMVSGAFAYDVLKQESPETITKVVEILKQHPEYATRWAKQLEKLDPDLRDQALFMLAARWPDDARGTKFDHPMWHYVDYGFIPPGQPASVTKVDPPDPNILIGYRSSSEILKNPESSAADKAVAICWIMHLTGDIHQPLHATSMFTTEYPAPKGDQGGTKVWIRAKEGGDPIKLHSFWDDLVEHSDRITDVKNRAIEIRSEYPREKLPELAKQVEPSDLQKWAEESFEQAKTSVYLDGKLAGSPVREKAPVLPEDYAKNTKPVAERRMADCGYRLADVLTNLMQSMPEPATPAASAPSAEPASPASAPAAD